MKAPLYRRTTSAFLLLLPALLAVAAAFVPRGALSPTAALWPSVERRELTSSPLIVFQEQRQRERYGERPAGGGGGGGRGGAYQGRGGRGGGRGGRGGGRETPGISHLRTESQPLAPTPSRLRDEFVDDCGSNSSFAGNRHGRRSTLFHPLAPGYGRSPTTSIRSHFARE
ncbi:hypothetical protein ACHAWF_003923 [Thalassiosira exigua]